MQFETVEGPGSASSSAPSSRSTLFFNGLVGRTDCLAVLLCSLSDPALGAVAEAAERAGVALHIHVSDEQLRSILAQPAAVHFELPAAVRSLSLDNGFFRGGYQLYRDAVLRDLHFDLPLHWGSQYVSACSAFRYLRLTHLRPNPAS
jgi:hypothetical protein